MTRRLGITAAAAVVAVTLVVVLAGWLSRSPTPGPATSGVHAVRPASSTIRFRGAHEDCSTRSEASFPGAFTSSANLVVGPLVLIGGAYTDARTVRDFGGNKFPLLVKAAHTVTVRLVQRGRRRAGLAYGPQLPGKTRLRDTYRTATFVACRAGKVPSSYSPDGPSASQADGVAVTFWSGFVLTRSPACIPLEIYVDDAPSARRVGLALGRRCG